MVVRSEWPKLLGITPTESRLRLRRSLEPTTLQFSKWEFTLRRASGTYDTRRCMWSDVDKRSSVCSLLLNGQIIGARI
jgi:hypothetical protein